jgi:plasmid stabilization system protein ParE
MSYRLVIVQPAEGDVEEIYAYIFMRSPQGAGVWYRAFLGCLDRIQRDPSVCAFAPEHAEFDFELRQALFKTRAGSPYRCLFTVVGDEIRILRIRGRGQPLLKAGDIAKR